MFICSLPALLTGTWLLFFPETPKYLAETGHNVQMLDVLMRMYSENSGEPPKEYITKLRNCENNNLNAFGAPNNAHQRERRCEREILPTDDN